MGSQSAEFVVLDEESPAEDASLAVASPVLASVVEDVVEPRDVVDPSNVVDPGVVVDPGNVVELASAPELEASASSSTGTPHAVRPRATRIAFLRARVCIAPVYTRRVHGRGQESSRGSRRVGVRLRT